MSVGVYDVCAHFCAEAVDGGATFAGPQLSAFLGALRQGLEELDFVQCFLMTFAVRCHPHLAQPSASPCAEELQCHPVPAGVIRTALDSAASGVMTKRVLERIHRRWGVPHEPQCSTRTTCPSAAHTGR